MENNFSKISLKARAEFIEFKDFKLGTEGSSKRIKIDSIDEYYISSSGILMVICSGKKIQFEYKKSSDTIKLLAKLDSLFNIRSL
jgi:hypothetical protein